jgi:hypothetical protein
MVIMQMHLKCVYNVTLLVQHAQHQVHSHAQLATQAIIYQTVVFHAAHPVHQAPMLIAHLIHVFCAITPARHAQQEMRLHVYNAKQVISSEATYVWPLARQESSLLMENARLAIVNAQHALELRMGSATIAISILAQGMAISWMGLLVWMNALMGIILILSRGLAKLVPLNVKHARVMTSVLRVFMDLTSLMMENVLSSIVWMDNIEP